MSKWIKLEHGNPETFPTTNSLIWTHCFSQYDNNRFVDVGLTNFDSSVISLLETGEEYKIDKYNDEHWVRVVEYQYVEMPELDDEDEKMKECKEEWDSVADHDATSWAKQFIDVLKNDPHIIIDEGFMIGWFANCLSTGYEWARQEGYRKVA